MHIAFLTPEYPHQQVVHSAGIGTSIKNLTKALVEYGVQVTLFIYGQKRDEIFIEDGIHFHLIAQKKYPIGGFYFYRKYLQDYIHKNIQGIDLIEAPDWTGITAFMRFEIPLVIRLHGSDTYFCHLEGRKQKWKNRFFEKKAIHRADGYIAPTRFAGEKTAQLFQIFQDKVQVIHYGLDLDNFKNENPTHYEKYRLLNIGTLIRKKGVFQLVEMFNKLVEQEPQARLMFIGSDAPDAFTGRLSTWEMMQEKMTNLAKQQITYLGKIPYQQVQEEIKQAHICVFPSFAETLGMVTIESMALKKAVVNTNIGWAQDLINHTVDGYMYHPDDINSYHDTIQSLFKDEKSVIEIGENARFSVENKFDIKKLIKENITFYNKFIDS